MRWNEHYEIQGEHAFLSASNYHWLNYTPEKLVTVFKNNKAKEEGVALHAFASIAIQRRLKLAKNKSTINLFVNDSIGFNMKSEQMLYYSPNCFGTADAISFRDNVLRIFDYKTGMIKASFKQLDIYAALFCLEYGVDPMTIEIEERIYQSNGFTQAFPDPTYIDSIMRQIIDFDSIIDVVKNEA